MPLWSVHHSPGLYSAQDKRDFAADVTRIYTRVGLPAFYVVVHFHPVDPESFLVGGEPTDRAVRIGIEHIARHLDDPDARRRTSDRISEVIAPYTTDRGLHTEFHVDETPRDLWMINGLRPRPPAATPRSTGPSRTAPSPTDRSRRGRRARARRPLETRRPEGEPSA